MIGSGSIRRLRVRITPLHRLSFPIRIRWRSFVAEARGIIAAALRGEGDAYGADSEKDTFVISVNPWYSFTGLQFQFPQNAGENIPLSVFGKIMVDMQGRRTMPVAVSFHHGFVDGYQVGRIGRRSNIISIRSRCKIHDPISAGVLVVFTAVRRDR